MTLPMPDSVDVASLPAGYAQYLGYGDGAYPTGFALAKRFPSARLIILTVTGQTLAMHGCDIEPGNLTAKDGAQWARQKLNRQPGSRPVMYASITGFPGYGMGDVLAALAVNNISRAQVRLLSAHYGAGEHICAWATCGLTRVTMDGTQWTDKWFTDSAKVDMSALNDEFFGTWTEELVQDLPIVQIGDQGDAVRTVQGLCQARGDFMPPLAMDGVYGPQTKLAVTTIQASVRITIDGIVGPQTWPVLLGIS